jgi:hypothetical protein
MMRRRRHQRYVKAVKFILNCMGHDETSTTPACEFQSFWVLAPVDSNLIRYSKHGDSTKLMMIWLVVQGYRMLNPPY